MRITGRSRGKLTGYPLERRIRNTILQLRLRRLKAKVGLICPICHTAQMFIEQRGKTEKGKLLVLVGCKTCHVGDVLPRHPTWKSYDLYNFVCDYWRQLRDHAKDPKVKINVPVFKYQKLYDSIYELLREETTFGKIECVTIMDDPEEE